MNIYKHLPDYAAAICFAALIATGCVKTPAAGDNGDKEGQYALTLTPDKIENAPYAGYQYKVEVASKSVWEIDHYPDWCALSPNFGNGDGSFTLTIAGNKEEQAREGEISITSGETTKIIKIFQEANPDSRDDLFLSIGDPAFLAALKAVYPSIDLNGDGRLTADEAERVQYMTITNAPNIKSLTGIKLFENLEVFFCPATSVEEANLSGMTKLKNLMLFDAPALANVNLTGCVSLENLNLSNTSISSLPLEEFENLKILECKATNITELDISGNRLLESLDCRECPELATVYVWWNPEEYPDGPDEMIIFEIDETTNILQKESI